jgi:hypothetical protein
MLSVTLNIAFIYCYAECHYADCHYAECYYADCHGAVIAPLFKSDRKIIARSFANTSQPW